MTFRGLGTIALLLLLWPGLTPPATGADAPPGAYILRVGDGLHWEVAGAAQSVQDGKIAADGTVLLAGLPAPLKVAGLDTGAAALAVARAWTAAKIYANPQVNLTVNAFAPQVAATINAAPTAISSDAYRLRPADLVSVSDASDPAAVKNYRIKVDGTVVLAGLSHPLKLVGLTLAEARKLIRQAYADEKISPNLLLNVELSQYAPRTVNVLGAVMKPGQIQIPAQQVLTLVSAIAAAGGPTERAATTATITRVLPDGSTQKVENVDLRRAMVEPSKDVSLQEGDTIYLGEAILTGEWR